MDSYVPRSRVCPTPSSPRTSLYLTSNVTGVSGSGYVEMGRTKVLCSVFGPRIQGSRMSARSLDGRVGASIRMAPFARQGRGRNGDEEREMANVLVRTIASAIRVEVLGMNEVDVVVVVIEDDGGVMAGAINAAGLALADAGIELYDLPAACNLSFCPGWVLDPKKDKESRLFVSNFSKSRQEFQEVDPEENRLDLDLEDVLLNSNSKGDDAEVKNANIIGGMLIAYLPALGQIIHMTQIGSIPPLVLSESITACLEECTKTYQKMQLHLLESLHAKVNK